MAAGGSCPDGAFEAGVAGAKVVAGDEAIDDGRPGMIIGKSAILKFGATAGPLGTTRLSTEGGTLVTAGGARVVPLVAATVGPSAQGVS